MRRRQHDAQRVTAARRGGNVRFTKDRVVCDRDHTKGVSGALGTLHMECRNAASTVTLHACPPWCTGVFLGRLVIQLAPSKAQLAPQLPPCLWDVFDVCHPSERRRRLGKGCLPDPQGTRHVRPLASVSRPESTTIARAQAALSFRVSQPRGARCALPLKPGRHCEAVATRVYREGTRAAPHHGLQRLGWVWRSPCRGWGVT